MENPFPILTTFQDYGGFATRHLSFKAITRKPLRVFHEILVSENRDPYFMVYLVKTLFNWVVFHLLYTPNNQGFPCKSKDYFLNVFSVKTIVLVGIYNQQFQGTIILMVFDFQGFAHCSLRHEVSKVLCWVSALPSRFEESQEGILVPVFLADSQGAHQSKQPKIPIPYGSKYLL